MTVTGFIYGYPVEYDPAEHIWRWTDTGEPAGPMWGGPARPCPSCGERPTPEGHDACLGALPGIVSACCGHGVEPPYFASGMACAVAYNGSPDLVVVGKP